MWGVGSATVRAGAQRPTHLAPKGCAMAPAAPPWGGCPCDRCLVRMGAVTTAEPEGGCSTEGATRGSEATPAAGRQAGQVQDARPQGVQRA